VCQRHLPEHSSDEFWHLLRAGRSLVFHLLRGRADFAIRTLPWVRGVKVCRSGRGPRRVPLCVPSSILPCHTADLTVSLLCKSLQDWWESLYMIIPTIS
jgi:hypothetical protein